MRGCGCTPAGCQRSLCPVGWVILKSAFWHPGCDGIVDWEPVVVPPCNPGTTHRLLSTNPAGLGRGAGNPDNFKPGTPAGVRDCFCAVTRRSPSPEPPATSGYPLATLWVDRSRMSARRPKRIPQNKAPWRSFNSTRVRDRLSSGRPAAGGRGAKQGRFIGPYI